MSVKTEFLIKAAKTLGKHDRVLGKTYAQCPYTLPHLRGAWQQGWREVDSRINGAAQ